VIPGLTTANVDVTMGWNGTVPSQCTVNINSFTIDAVFKTFTLTGKPTYTVPYFGQYCSNGTSCL
jgi:hypothetical protein